jgi:hypothetical protein
MKLQFDAVEHKYSTVDKPEEKWTSVTTLIGKFKEPFDQSAVAKNVVKKKKSKWYGMKPQDVINVWKAETDRALTLGSWYHDQREEQLLACNTLERHGKALSIFKPFTDGALKLSPDQNVTDGIYPEHLVYLKSAKICGQADRVEIVNGVVNIYDYKTNKEIKTEPYVDWEGKRKTLQGPLQHIDDCNLMHYALQLSSYMYMIMKHNHNLKPGVLEIHHVVFEVESYDKNGYPKTALDDRGEPIVKEVVPYELPYLKKEVIAMINYIKR